MLKRLSAVLFLGLSTLLVVPATFATPITFVTTLSGANENPTNASAGFGTGIVQFDLAAHTLAVNIVFGGLTGTTTASHIHCCAVAPVNAGVATTTPTFLGFPLGVTSGSYNVVLDTLASSSWNPAFIALSGGTTAGAEAALFAGMMSGQTYVNIHTSTLPGGEIRGVLRVPEPATLALLACGLVLVAGSLRRRRRAF